MSYKKRSWKNPAEIDFIFSIHKTTHDWNKKKTKSKCILKLLLLKTNYLWVYNFRRKEKKNKPKMKIKLCNCFLCVLLSKSKRCFAWKKIKEIQSQYLYCVLYFWFTYVLKITSASKYHIVVWLGKKAHGKEKPKTTYFYIHA